MSGFIPEPEDMRQMKEARECVSSEKMRREQELRRVNTVSRPEEDDVDELRQSSMLKPLVERLTDMLQGSMDIRDGLRGRVDDMLGEVVYPDRPTPETQYSSGVTAMLESMLINLSDIILDIKDDMERL
jgi:hypothetical protein